MQRNLIFGLLLIGLGIAFFLDQSGLLSIRTLFRSGWPIAIILIGLWLLMRKRTDASDKSEESIQTFSASAGDSPKPTEKVISLNIKAGIDAGRSQEEPPAEPSPRRDHPTTVEAAYATRLPAIPSQAEPGRARFDRTFGDLFIDCKGLDLQNVSVTSMFGDTDILLRGGKLAPGLNRLIVSGFVGDTHVIVPKGFPVAVHCSNFLGDVDLFGRKGSGLGNSSEGQSADYASATEKLYIVVKSFLGDIRVYQTE